MANGRFEVVESLQVLAESGQGNLEEIAEHEEYGHCPQ
jgi:hypothetical protein